MPKKYYSQRQVLFLNHKDHQAQKGVKTKEYPGSPHQQLLALLIKRSDRLKLEGISSSCDNLRFRRGWLQVAGSASRVVSNPVADEALLPQAGVGPLDFWGGPFWLTWAKYDDIYQRGGKEKERKEKVPCLFDALRPFRVSHLPSQSNDRIHKSSLPLLLGHPLEMRLDFQHLEVPLSDCMLMDCLPQRPRPMQNVPRLRGKSVHRKRHPRIPGKT